MKKPAPQHPIDTTVQQRLDRLEHLIDDEYEGKPKVFEEKTGIRMAQVGQWFTGYRALRDKALKRLEEQTKKPAGWFDAPKDYANTAPGPTIKGEVPLLSNVQAGMYTEFVDNLHPGVDGEYEKIPTTVPVNRYTFALRVSGDSMEPDFVEGMLLVVEPELDPMPGDYVIAKNGSEETTFKQLVRDGADWYLKPINSRYPIKPLADCTIIGVVRAVEKRFR